MAGIKDRLHKMFSSPDDEYDDYPETPTEVTSGYDRYDRYGDEPVRRSSQYSPRDFSANKVVNISAKAQLHVVLFRPVTFGEETRTIADELISRNTVVLNLENTEKDVARRVIDFLSGVAYANKGKIKRIGTNIFIITPYNVDFMGEDVLDELESNGVYF